MIIKEIKNICAVKHTFLFKDKSRDQFTQQVRFS